MARPDDPAWRSRSALRAELVERGELLPVEVEGVRGERYIVAGDLAALEAAEAEVAAGGPPGGYDPGVAFLAPLDPFVWDRDFLRSLYDFDYVWEVYVPEKKRRWGYYVLPILFGDRLVGRIEPRIDRKSGALRILGLWWEPGFDPLAAPGFIPAFAEALDVHRRFGGLNRVVLPRTHPHRPVARCPARASCLRVARGAGCGTITPRRIRQTATSRAPPQHHEENLIWPLSVEPTPPGPATCPPATAPSAPRRAVRSTRWPTTWASRIEAADGRTSPEELLAAAHASCFSMAFSNELAKRGFLAERLAVTANVTLDMTDAGRRVISSALTVSGSVPGIDAATFAEIAEVAKNGCPISNALKGNVVLSVEPTLES